VTRVK